MLSSHVDNSLVGLAAPGSLAAEQYQGLRINLERLQNTSGVRTIAVTSPGVSDGKTVTAINLAAVLAQRADARVLLIDADLRRPAVGPHLGIADRGRPGWANLLGDDGIALSDALQPLDQSSNLDVVLAGSSSISAHELFRTPRCEQLLRDVRERYDFVILDTPPLLPVYDAALLARVVDGMVVVVAAHETPRKTLGEALSLLDESKTLGIVFNGDDGARFRKYRAYYQH